MKQPFLPSLGDHYTLTAMLVKRDIIPNEDYDGDDGNMVGIIFLEMIDSGNKLNAFETYVLASH